MRCLFSRNLQKSRPPRHSQFLNPAPTDPGYLPLWSLGTTKGVGSEGSGGRLHALSEHVGTPGRFSSDRTHDKGDERGWRMAPEWTEALVFGCRACRGLRGVLPD